MANIAGELKPDIRELLMSQKLFALCAKILKQEGKNNSLTNNIGFFIGNMARTKPRLKILEVQEVIPGLCKVINTETDVELLNNYLYALSYITDADEPPCINAVVNLGMCPKLVSLCG